MAERRKTARIPRHKHPNDLRSSVPTVYWTSNAGTAYVVRENEEECDVGGERDVAAAIRGRNLMRGSILSDGGWTN